MANRFGLEDEEEDVLAPKEPQVTSEIPQERKLARELRIKRRQEALKRVEQPLEEAIPEEETTLIEQATANAAVELQALGLEGKAKVTNVKVLTDGREVTRRNDFFDRTQLNLENIEAEAAEAQTQYEVITANWDVALQLKDPLEIDAAIEQQRQRCDALLHQKDQLITNLKDNLKEMDESYFIDLDKQDREIKELSERIEKQMTIMQRAYETQLDLIEQAIAIERESMVDHNNKRWEALYKQRDRDEVQHLEDKFVQLEEHKQHVESIMWDHNEKYRQAKIELETLIQDLQKELEKLKSTCIINTEKIGYTYQVLKKREEENIFVRSEQKRKLNKMSDVANGLRTKIRKAAEDGANEEVKAGVEITKLMEMMQHLEKKCYHFSNVNDYKFQQVWRMCASKCSRMARDLRRSEVTLFAQVLCEPPPPPPPPPPFSPLSIKHEQPTHDDAKKHPEEDDPNDKHKSDSKERLIRHILSLVSDNSGFLVENRLLDLMRKYPSTSRNLCTLDAVFMALEISGEADVELLCEVFLKYAFCPICIGMEGESTDFVDNNFENASQEDSANKIRIDKLSVRARSSVARSLSVSTSRSIHIATRTELAPEEMQMVNEADEILQRCGDPQVGLSQIKTMVETSAAAAPGRRAGLRGVTVFSQPNIQPKSNNPYLCQVGHPLEIEAMQVLTALNDFVTVFVSPEQQTLNDILDDLKPPDFTTISRTLSKESIEKYWQGWKDMFPPEKERLWDGVITGLNNYLNILQERERLHAEVQQLRDKNSDLKRILYGAIPELPQIAPKYLRPEPPNFIGAQEDFAQGNTLPPIQRTNACKPCSVCK